MRTISAVSRARAHPRLIVVGVDGASWRVLTPMLEAGRLPHFRRLRREGTSGVLRSAALNSPLLWTTIFTGKTVEKHGVEFFGATAQSVRAQRLWEIFDQRGLPVGVCGPLVTWPPRPVNGFLIPDLFALGPETHPPEFRLLQELALEEKGRDRRWSGKRVWRLATTLSRWGVTPRTWAAVAAYAATARLRRHPLDRYWRKVLLQPRLYGDVFVALCRRFRPALACFHFHATDTISHRYWRYVEPERFPETPAGDIRRFSEVIPVAYEAADRVLGRILQMAGPDTAVVVLSDHGFEPRPVGRFKYDLRFDRLLALLGLSREAVPARLSNTFILQLRGSRGAAEVAQQLEGFRVRATGEPLFRIREVGADRLSFLLTDLNRRWNGTALHVPGMGEVAFEELFEDRGFVDSGQHAPDGVLFLWGAPFRRGATVEEATILDITPTALYLSGLPVADDMDGRILTEAFTDGFLRRHLPERIPTYEGEDLAPLPGQDMLPEEASERIIQRLKSLGYL